MNSYDIETLNEDQKKALLKIEGAVLVTAGAGSGKTKLLTHRIAYLIKELNVSPYRILALTFTNKAAKEMRERVSSMIDGNESDKVWISTFHSMCVKILRSNIHKVEGYNSNFSIYSDADTDRVLKRIYAEKNIEDDAVKKAVPFHISNIKSNNLEPNAYMLQNDYVKDIKLIVDIYFAYEEELLKNNALDFDDLLTKTYELFISNEDVRKYYADRFEYVLVDEFQDTNQIQYDLVKMLSSTYKNIFVVGDEDQCIYSWRGANFRNIFNFKNDFENVAVFKLEQNYRSSKRILAAANSVIKINKTRLDKSLWTSKDDGDEVEFACVNDEQAEADYVCRNILKLVSNGGYKFSDFAVLMRLNALSMPFEEKFLSYNIPYKIFGGFKFFERVEIKNIIAYLRLFVNPDDEISFLRVINFPKRGIGQGAIDKLKLIANANNVHLLQAALMLDDLGLSANSVMSKFCNFARIFRSIKNEMENLSIEEIVVKVVNLFSIKSAYNGKNESDDDKKMNIDNFIVSAEQFTAKQPEADLCEYLESISLVSDLDGMEEGDNNVKIATVHAVKGLEFKVVFVVGLEEKIFPIQRASSDSDDLEEERRLMYVAITRAEEKLFLTKANTRFLYGKRDYMIASRFLGEAGFYDAKSATSGFASRREENKPFLGQHSDGGQASQFGFSKNIFSFSGAAKAFGENKKDISIYKVGQKVLHSRFGEGVIKSISLEEKCADIDFCGFGVKTLMLEIAPLEIVQ